MIIVDTRPIVALLDRRDSFHVWARDAFARLRPPHATCEPVLAEACHLLGPAAADAVMELGERGFLICPFSLATEWPRLRALMKRYANVPMSLADACLVRMSELDASAKVMTLDGDFRMYRRHGRQIVPILGPR